MSTKFSIRPAPRKRPWLCKRSPPCLIPPPIPKSLLCTIYIAPNVVPPSPAAVRGTFLLLPTAILYQYWGRLDQGSNYFVCTFDYNHAQALGQAHAWWKVGIYTNGGPYTLAPIRVPPKLLYRAAVVDTLGEQYVTNIVITE